MEVDKHRHVVVTRGGEMIGVISVRDLMIDGAWRSWDVPVGLSVRSAPMTCSPETPVAEAAMRMVRYGIGCLPVVKDEDLIGIISRTDVIQAGAVLFSEEIEVAPPEAG